MNPYDRLVGFINRHQINPTEEHKLREIIAEIKKYESQPSYTKEQLIEEIGRRQKLILSEPAGSVRETMIENLLIDLQ